jgi:iron(III) transport system substrate-binding protein
VVAYCSVDEAYARPILDEFEKRSGVRVDAVYDTEAGKTTGLVNKIRAERGRPRADVLFSGEIFNTIRLADEGLLASYDSPAAGDIPASFRDPGRRWTAIALRKRVLAYSSKRVDPNDLPTFWKALADERWAGKLAFANPLFGTTRGHVGAMVALWGKDETGTFLRELKENGAIMVDGNASAVRAVLDGRSDWCMTDSDDVYAAQADGGAVGFIEPRMVAGEGQTLLIPSTVAMIKDARNPESARMLVDYLVSRDVEEMLHKSASRNISVRTIGGDGAAVDYVKIAEAMPVGAELTREILIR